MKGSHYPEFKMAFPTEVGRFVISPDPFEDRVFRLSVEEPNGNEQILASFVSIHEAIVSVIQQATGFPRWDGLALSEIPYRVHDIICWEFDFFREQKEVRESLTGSQDELLVS